MTDSRRRPPRGESGALSPGSIGGAAQIAPEVEGQRLRTLLSTLPGLMHACEVGGEYPVTFVGGNARDLVGYAPKAFTSQPGFWESHIHPEDREGALDGLRRAATEGQASFDYRFRHREGRWVWLHDEVRLARDEEGEPLELVGCCSDLSELRRVAEIHHGYSRVLQELAGGSELGQVLEHLCRVVEGAIEGLRCTVLLLDAEGKRLRSGAAPSMPSHYNAAVDGVSIGPTVGSCGASAFHGRRVEVDDVMQHPNWEGLRELAESADVRACWSEPILSTEGAVLGTFAMYYSEPRLPGEREVELIQSAAHIAGLGIASSRVREELLSHRDSLQRAVEERTSQLEGKNQKLRSLASELVLAEERERRRLAVDLHDGLSQYLALARLKLGALDVTQRGPLAETLAEVESLIERADRVGRSLTFELSPPVLYDLGIQAGLQWLAEEIQRCHGLTVEYREDGRSVELEERVRDALFRVAREALINVVKHAQATKAQVELSVGEGHLTVVVRDDGVSFDPHRVGSKGFGLFGARERLGQLGGSMELESSLGQGTRVTLRVPLKGSSELS